jgi:hypothetical protein
MGAPAVVGIVLGVVTFVVAYAVLVLALRVWALTQRVAALEAARDGSYDEENAAASVSVPRLQVVQPSSQPATCSHPPHQRQDASTLRKRQFFCHACRATVPGGE